MADGGPRIPFVDYRDDRKDPQNYVTVSLEIKGIKKKVFGEGAANANITFTKDNRSFCVNIILEKGGKSGTEEYEYRVKKLPEPIDPDRCKVKVKQDEVVLQLRKLTSGSWSHQLSSIGLELEPD